MTTTQLCEDVQWNIASWVARKLKRDKLSRLLDPANDRYIEELAIEAYDAGDDKLDDLLDQLVSYRDKSATCKTVHLSALRSALRLIAQANKQFPEAEFPHRLGRFRKFQKAAELEAGLRQPSFART